MSKSMSNSGSPWTPKDNAQLRTLASRTRPRPRADGHDSWLRWAHGEVERLRKAALAPPSMVDADEPSADTRG